MTMTRPVSLAVFLLAGAAALVSGCKSPLAPPPKPKDHVSWKPEAGFAPIFNGEDLTGWGFPGGPALDGVKETPDKRFTAGVGMLVAHQRTTAEKAEELRTTKQFEGDFILRLQFRASPEADSGIFIRGKQLQCRDYATVGPYHPASYKAQNWNDIEITVKGGVARCTCNGEVLEEALAIPNATGGIGIESDQGTMEYRHLELKPLPAK